MYSFVLAVPPLSHLRHPAESCRPKAVFLLFSSVNQFTGRREGGFNTVDRCGECLESLFSLYNKGLLIITFEYSTCYLFLLNQAQELNETVDSSPEKKKKRKSEAEQYDLIAVGTASGSVLLYNPEMKEIMTQLTHAPPHAIRDVAWVSKTKLFSLAANGTLVLWNVTIGKRV